MSFPVSTQINVIKSIIIKSSINNIQLNNWNWLYAEKRYHIKIKVTIFCTIAKTQD